MKEGVVSCKGVDLVWKRDARWSCNRKVWMAAGEKWWYSFWVSEARSLHNRMASASRSEQMRRCWRRRREAGRTLRNKMAY